MSDAAPSGRVGIAVLADDLIWATRLADGVRRAGGEPVPVRSLATLGAALPTVGGCIVDLTARAYDGIEAISARAARPASRSIAVGQHDDAEARRRGDDRRGVAGLRYRALFEHGDRVLAAWISTLDAAQEPVG